MDYFHCIHFQRSFRDSSPEWVIKSSEKRQHSLSKNSYRHQVSPPSTTPFIQVTRRSSLNIQSPFRNYMLILNYFHAHRAPRYQDYRCASSTHPGVWSIKEMILPALGIFTICLLILMFPSATGLVCQKKYSEVHNLAFQGPSWDIDKKFGTEPIAQERCFTKSSRWLTVLSGCPRTPRGTPFVT